jgi:hypothetical protein
MQALWSQAGHVYIGALLALVAMYFTAPAKSFKALNLSKSPWTGIVQGLFVTFWPSP